MAMARPNVRERLLDAGVEIFHRCGFNGCGVQEITDAAGVPKGSFYNHFASKEALGAAVLDRYWQQCASATLGILEDSEVRPRGASGCAATSPRWPPIWRGAALPGAA